MHLKKTYFSTFSNFRKPTSTYGKNKFKPVKKPFSPGKKNDLLSLIAKIRARKSTQRKRLSLKELSKKFFWQKRKVSWYKNKKPFWRRKSFKYKSRYSRFILSLASNLRQVNLKEWRLEDINERHGWTYNIKHRRARFAFKNKICMRKIFLVRYGFKDQRQLNNYHFKSYNKSKPLLLAFKSLEGALGRTLVRLGWAKSAKSAKKIIVFGGVSVGGYSVRKYHSTLRVNDVVFLHKKRFRSAVKKVLKYSKLARVGRQPILRHKKNPLYFFPASFEYKNRILKLKKFNFIFNKVQRRNKASYCFFSITFFKSVLKFTAFGFSRRSLNAVSAFFYTMSFNAFLGRLLHLFSFFKLLSFRRLKFNTKVSISFTTRYCDRLLFFSNFLLVSQKLSCSIPNKKISCFNTISLQTFSLLHSFFSGYNFYMIINNILADFHPYNLYVLNANSSVIFEIFFCNFVSFCSIYLGLFFCSNRSLPIISAFFIPLVKKFAVVARKKIAPIIYFQSRRWLGNLNKTRIQAHIRPNKRNVLKGKLHNLKTSRNYRHKLKRFIRIPWKPVNRILRIKKLSNQLTHPLPIKVFFKDTIAAYAHFFKRKLPHKKSLVAKFINLVTSSTFVYAYKRNRNVFLLIKYLASQVSKHLYSLRKKQLLRLPLNYPFEQSHKKSFFVLTSSFKFSSFAWVKSANLIQLNRKVFDTFSNQKLY